MKNERGITLIAVITTVILLIILTSVTIYEIDINMTKNFKQKMDADIAQIREKVLIYYNKYGEIPKTDRSIGLFTPQIEYWEVDLNKLEGISLNLGRGFFDRGEPLKPLEFNKSDIYVINNNFEVVYLKGISYNGRTYYQRETDENQVDELNNKTITVIAEEGGSVVGFENGTKSCRLGESVLLKAVPDVITYNETEYSWNFAGWYLNDVLQSTDSEYTITVTDDVTYVARFEIDYTLIYYANGSIVVDTSTEINENSGYKGDTNITKVLSGTQLLTIGNYVFDGCTSLEEVELKGVTALSHWLFQNCSNLRKVKAPKALTGGWQTFRNCTKLEEVELGSVGNPVSSIVYSNGPCFSGCTQNNLTIKVYIANGEISLAGEPWGATNATIEYYNATTGDLENVIWGNKYQGNTEIALTQLPNANKISKIKENAFNGCTNLKLTSLPESVTTIGNYVFDSCTSLDEIELKGVTALSHWLFQNCSNLRKVKAPKALTGGWQTFKNCTKLEEVELGSVGNPVSSIVYSNGPCFSGCTQNNLTIKVYIADGTNSLTGAPWGATNATIEYYNAKTGDKIN